MWLRRTLAELVFLERTILAKRLPEESAERTRFASLAQSVLHLFHGSMASLYWSVGRGGVGAGLEA